MKKKISLVVVVAIIVAGIIFVPKIAHTCDDCEKFWVPVMSLTSSRICFLAKNRLFVRSVQKSNMHFPLLWENLLMISNAICLNNHFPSGVNHV